MEKRVIIFAVLSVAILVGYYPLLGLLGIEVPKAPPAKNAPQERPAAEAPVPTGAAAPEAQVTVPAMPATPAPVPPQEALKEREIVVDTDLYRAHLSTRGGVITQWELKAFFDDDRTTPVRLVNPPPVGARMPLTVEVEGAAGFDTGLYAADQDHLEIAPDGSGTIRLTRVDPATGAALTKVLTFHGDSYAVDLDVETQGLTSDYTVLLGSNFGIRKWGMVKIGFVGISTLVDGDVHREKPDKMQDAPLVRQGEIDWVVTQDKYFLSGLLPKTPPKAVVSRASGKENVLAGLVVGDGAPSSFTLYAGPKEYQLLKDLHANMQENIDFGWFMLGTWSLVRLLAEPMFLMLRGINGLTHNWGVSIILLTLLIKTVFMPLTHKSYKSMRAMAAIQPQVKAIQKKYKDNKEKLSKETMALYREHNINPLGGCFPILLQIPFFIAFFNILYTAIELRHAPFAGWIVDLSAKDPYYVLPIIMGASMFVQQKIQPSTMDPKQARMMLFLPVIFTFFFMNFPAGLVLYWLFNNLFTITQQWVTRRFLEKPAAAAAK